MALNVVPLLFVALPFVLTMDAMYDLYQDFALPSDRRGWGLTDDLAKHKRVSRAYLKYFNNVLAHQAKEFAKWKKTDAGKKWVRENKTAIETAQKTLDRAKDDGSNQRPQLQENLNTLKGNLLQKYGITKNDDGSFNSEIDTSHRWYVANSDAIPGRDKYDVTPQQQTIQQLLDGAETDDYNELNRKLNELNKEKFEEGKAFTGERVNNAIKASNALSRAHEGRSGAHSGVFKWVIYNQDPRKGEHNMLAWNYPTLLLAGVLINMLGEYYAKFSPVVSGPQAKNLCDILDSVLIVHVAIVGIQLLASLYFNLNAPKNPNARNPSLDLMDIHNHPEDFVSAVLIGLFNHLGTAVLVHTFVRASFGNTLRTSGVSMSKFSRGSRRSRRSRRSSRRRRR
jgi:hypothetical protein